MDKPRFVYVTYIKTTAEKVWQALTEGEITRQFWGGQANVSKSGWQTGSDWHHVFVGDPASNYGGGKVVEADRPHRLVLTWGAPDEGGDPLAYDRVIYEIAEDQGVVRLQVTNEGVEPGSDAGETWPKIMAGLKSLLETGEPLPPFWDRDAAGGFTTVRFS